jgi:hypothetical protein
MSLVIRVCGAVYRACKIAWLRLCLVCLNFRATAKAQQSVLWDCQIKNGSICSGGKQGAKLDWIAAYSIHVCDY